MLKDAKEQREVQEKQEHENEEARKAHFGSLFDDFQGIMLSTVELQWLKQAWDHEK